MLRYQGLMDDVAREALALSNFKLNFKVINWARAKEMVKSGLLDSIIGMSKDHTTPKQYYFSNTQLGESQPSFFKGVNTNI